VLRVGADVELTPDGLQMGATGTSPMASTFVDSYLVVDHVFQVARFARQLRLSRAASLSQSATVEVQLCHLGCKLSVEVAFASQFREKFWEELSGTRHANFRHRAFAF
jgi:hypothetical protein